MVKNPPAMQETWVQSLGSEDPLEKEMAAHSSILAWRISWIEEPGGLQSMGSQRVGHDRSDLAAKLWASFIALLVKNLPAVQETRVRFLNWEDPPEKEMAPHSSTLAWRVPWTEEPGGPQSIVSQRIRQD